jgi:hypothetical protein
MQWITKFYKDVKNAPNEQLKLWLNYMKLFKDDENAEISIDRKKREQHREIIYAEMKIRGIRRDRSVERGKGKKIYQKTV